MGSGRSGRLRVASVGDSCVDVYGPAFGGAAAGGNALNVAVGLVRAGAAGEYVGEVGSDSAGRAVLDAAARVGVGIGHVHVVNGRTWVAHITVEEGTARVAWEDPGACGPYEMRGGEPEFLAGFDHVHLANLSDPSGALDLLRRLGVSTSYDYGRAWPADGVLPRIVFASADGPGARAEAIARAEAACARGADLAVVMLGSEGSIAHDGRRVHVQPARPIRPTDTLGAGDRYIAEFLVHLLQGAALPDAMEGAGAAASETCLHWAAWPQPSMTVELEVAEP